MKKTILLILTILILSSIHTPSFAGNLFIRGDANQDGNIDISDAVYILRYLFVIGPMGCQDAADVNDDGVIDIGDAVRLLDFLFWSGAAPIPAPYPEPGQDPTPDTLRCGEVKSPTIVFFGPDPEVISGPYPGQTLNLKTEVIPADPSIIQCRFYIDRRLVQDWGSSYVYSWSLSEADAARKHTLVCQARNIQDTRLQARAVTYIYVYRRPIEP